jgi:hypothetical protein
MKNTLFIILSILSLSVFGQVQDTAFLAGKAQFSQSGAGSGYWQVSGTFTDESGLNDAGGIQVGDVLFFSDAGIGYFLPITVIVSATPPSFTIRVSNVGITNIISVPTTSGVIYRPSTGEYLTFTAGISNPDQQTFQSRLAKKLDALAGGDGNGIYSGSGVLAGNTTVAGAYTLDLDPATVRLYGRYNFADVTPTTTANAVSIHKWIGNGTVPVASFGPITNDYEVTITGGNTDSKLYIRADVTGVTASYSSNLLTITIPGNGKIHSADWRMVASDVQASADAGGVTNWTTVRFVNTSHNTSIADMRCPDVTKVAIPSSGSLSASNSATYDTDNNPAVSVIDVGGNAITVRVGGLSIGTQGFILKFTQI